MQTTPKTENNYREDAKVARKPQNNIFSGFQRQLSFLTSSRSSRPSGSKILIPACPGMGES
jgi:hypothetical protein